MPSNPTVSNTSCLIALESIGQLRLLEQLYQEILVPDAVAKEWGVPLPGWVKLQTICNLAVAQSLRLQLGAGEAEAIALAVECGAQRLILDDQRARQVAANMGVAVTGTVGIALAAKKRGILPLVRPLFDQLRAAGFWLSDALYHQAIGVAGE